MARMIGRKDHNTTMVVQRENDARSASRHITCQEREIKSGVISKKGERKGNGERDKLVRESMRNHLVVAVGIARSQKASIRSKTISNIGHLVHTRKGNLKDFSRGLIDSGNNEHVGQKVKIIK